MQVSTSFLRTLPSAEKEELLKLTSLDELPKSRYATKLAVTAYPTARRGRKAVFSHIEVYKMVETIAGRMREAGIRPGTVCAFALPTSFESIIYFYALMWIAAIAAPIDPDLEQQKFNDELNRLGAKVLVSPYVPDDTDNELYVKCHNAATELKLLEWHIHRTTNEGVILETHGSMIGTGAAWAGGAGDFKLDPDEIAVHMPSAVAVVPLSHRALCAAAKSFASTYNLAVNMSTMLAPPLHTIHGVVILIAAFYSGGHIVLPGYGGFEADKFWDLAKKHNITWLSAGPDQILDLFEENEKNTSNQQLTFVRSCGDRCIAPELITKVEISLKTPVYESYGTPEACGFATANREGHASAGTFGKAVDGIELAIFDVESRDICENGKEGEITVSGAHVAQSYLNSEAATEAAVFKTERTDSDGNSVVVHWFATGDRGTMDDDGYLTVIGDSRTLRAAEIAAQEERKVREAEEAEKLAAEEKERKEAAAAEEAAAAAAAAAQAEAEEKARAEEEERLREEERLAEEKRKEEEAAEEERRKEEEAAEEEKRQRESEEEEKRKKEEEEEELRRKEEEEKEAAAAAAAAAATAAAAAAAAEKVREKEAAEKADRLLALERAGVENPQDLDEETANAILARLEAVEENHRKLQEDVEGRNAAELEDMKRRVAEAEAEAERAATGGLGENGQVVDVRMEELEAAVMAAAASAESSASNTREAVKAAKEVADAAYGTNQSQPVEVKASTGDQGALTKTVRVPLDDVEAAMRNHPAVELAKAFGRKDRRFGAEVFCAIVPKRGARVSETWLKLFAQSALPAPMVPKKFYYIEKLPEGISRRELSESPLLQDLSSFSGFSEVKHVKGPQWKPKRRVGP